MGIVTALTSSFSVNLILTCIVMFSAPIILNYTVFTSVPSYGFQAVGLCLFFLAFCVGCFISYHSSTSYCDRYKMKLILGKGLTQGIVTLLVYVIVFWIGFFKSPFIDIGGDTLFSNSIGEAFFVGMTNIIFMIKNHFASQSEGCKMSGKEASKAYKNIEKDLDSREKPTPPEKITMTA